MALHIDHLIITLYFIKQHDGGKHAKRLGILNLKRHSIVWSPGRTHSNLYPTIEHPCTSHWAYCHT